MIVVTNASPLIALSAVERLDLLQSLFKKITVPEAVYNEVVREGRDKPGAEAVSQADWIVTKTVRNQKRVKELRQKYHPGQGEAETIELTRQIKTDWVVIDELPARKAVAELQLKLIGTLGVLLLAKQRDLVANVKEVLDELKRKGFRLSQSTYQKVLLQGGEAPV